MDWALCLLHWLILDLNLSRPLILGIFLLLVLLKVWPIDWLPQTKEIKGRCIFHINVLRDWVLHRWLMHIGVLKHYFTLNRPRLPIRSVWVSIDYELRNFLQVCDPCPYQQPRQKPFISFPEQHSGELPHHTMDMPFCPIVIGLTQQQ